MEPIRKVRGKVLPLNRADVDTDQIIPAKYLKLVEPIREPETIFRKGDVRGMFVGQIPIIDAGSGRSFFPLGVAHA